VSQSRSASASPLKYDRTLAAAPPIISRSEVLRSFWLQTEKEPARPRESSAAAAESRWARAATS